MKTPRLSLITKALLLALLNVALLGLVFILFARLQFRLDAGSFLLAPAQNRITAIAHNAAMELDETPLEDWDRVLARYGEANSVTCYLFDEEGRRVAGPDTELPSEVMERIPRRERAGRPKGPPQPGEGPPAPKKSRERRNPGQPTFLMWTSDPTQYWAGVRVTLSLDRNENPKPGTLVLTSTSLVGNRLFFDPMPWLAVVLAVLLVSIACWLLLVRGMTHSISLMTRTAGQIAYKGRRNNRPHAAA